MDTTQLRAEHDAVLAAVSSRQSIVHFARAGVAGFVVFLLLCFAGAFWWDFRTIDPIRHQFFLVLAALVSLYVVAELVRGRGLYRAERIALERLRALRAQLKLESPEAFLPRALN